MNFVQSFITNISFPTSLEELYKYVHLFDIEKVLGCSYSDFIDDYDKRINELSGSDPQELSKLSKKIFDFAQENFSIEAFENNFNKIMTDII